MTLPDYLAPGLRLVFVGINPGLYSVARGHYFARPTNRFWPAFSRSRLSEPVRAALGRDVLRPEDDAALLGFGIGFTDVVKKPTSNAAGLAKDDFRAGAPQLLDRLKVYQPDVACFHGLTAYRAFARYALGIEARRVSLGPQERQWEPRVSSSCPTPALPTPTSGWRIWWSGTTGWRSTCYIRR